MQFQAGQYINIQLLNIEGTRAFSIANTPSEANLIELHIRKVQGGAATRYVHDELSVGEEMVLSGPYGQFLRLRLVRLGCFSSTSIKDLYSETATVLCSYCLSH